VPRRSVIEDHPKKKQIVKAIVQGRGKRSISVEFGISEGSVQRYKEKIADKVDKHDKLRDLSTADQVVEMSKDVMDKLQKMLTACDEELTHPNDPLKYFLGPRADEIEVYYYEEVETESGVKQIPRTEDLHVLLDKAGIGPTVSRVKMKRADTRDLLVKASMAIQKQLDSIANIMGLVIKKMELSGRGVIVLKPGQMDIPEDAGRGE
jgi:hypothetical protein